MARFAPKVRFHLAVIFAPRWKARYLEQARLALGQGQQQEPEEALTSHPSLLPHRERQIARTGKDPLVCTRCRLPMECHHCHQGVNSCGLRLDKLVW